MKLKVLVVDDSEMVLEATSITLEDAGMEVVTLSSPALFPATLNRQKPDLVLLDVSMPIMGGDSLVELARKNHLYQCPIVLFSDRPEASLKTLAQACGAAGYIRKSDKPEDLLSAIAKFLPTPSAEGNRSNEVFLVDDQPMIRSLLEEHLKRAGCTPVLIETAEKCLEMARAKPPAMIILDLNLPGMRGDDACRALRAEAPLRAVPVVMMTARTKPAEVMRWWECGADDYLPKPVRPDQLEGKIRAIRNQRPAVMAPQEKGHKLLLASAEGGQRNRLGLILESSGFKVRSAATTNDVLSALADDADGFDAAICDVGILGTAWQQVVDKLRGRAKKTLWILSANTPPEVRAALSITGEGSAAVDQHHAPELMLARLNLLLKRVAYDLRAVERLPFYAGVEFRLDPMAAWACGFSHDLSPAGLFVRTLTPPPKGTTIDFRVADLPEPIEGRALVAWSNEYGPRITYSYPVGMGLQLSALDKTMQLRVQSAYESARKGVQSAR